MKLNFKVILGGGILLYLAQMIVSMITGPLIHEGYLEQIYDQTEEFWRPELNQEPPDMATLMPRWIAAGLLMAFIMSGVYDNIRAAFSGSGIIKGLKYGVVLGLLHAGFAGGWSGIFNLPETIWAVWIAEYFLYTMVGGMALGWFAEKFAPE